MGPRLFCRGAKRPDDGRKPGWREHSKVPIIVQMSQVARPDTFICPYFLRGPIHDLSLPRLERQGGQRQPVYPLPTQIHKFEE